MPAPPRVASWNIENLAPCLGDEADVPLQK